MGNSLCMIDRSENPSYVKKEEYDKLNNDNKLLMEKITKLELIIIENIEDKKTSNLSKKTLEKIDLFIEEWYLKNNDDIDIGKFDIPIIGNIDLFPDYMEKHLYKKLIAATLSFIKESAIQIE